jgi:hypothetical protein
MQNLRQGGTAHKREKEKKTYFYKLGTMIERYCFCPVLRAPGMY